MAEQGRVIIKDRGLKQIFSNAVSVNGMKIAVGIQGPEAGAVEHDETDLSNVELGVVHEFGTAGVSLGRSGATSGGIPARSFIRSTFDQKQKRWLALMARAAKVLYSEKVLNPRQVLGVVGEKAKSDIIRTINKGIPPALVPSTIRRKGSSKPLIDTGQLKASITWAIRK